MNEREIREGITHHRERLEAALGYYQRAASDGLAESYLEEAAQHAAIFNALTAIAAGK